MGDDGTRSQTWHRGTRVRCCGLNLLGSALCVEVRLSPKFAFVGNLSRDSNHFGDNIGSIAQ